MDIALSIAAFLFSITGIVGCIVPIIPGVALSYVGLLCASFCSYSEISSATLWIWLAVTVAVSVIDYFLPGCPPSADAFWSFLTDLMAGRTPYLGHGLIHYD